ncbi:MAG TPA: GNAT family N-acetyltransferase [Acidimicrobiales bacterium]|jgi:ribosomal protein S18 acetylase RimI-like enzyme
MTGVREAGTNDITEIAEVLVRSFHDDPVMSYLFKDDDGRRKKTRALFVGESKRAIGKAKGRVDTTDEGPVKGAAIWFKPDEWRTGGMELLGQIPLLFTLGLETPRALSLLGQMEKVHPKEPHWYLAVLGTDPQHQGKGVGSSVIAPILTKCDDEGIGAYLESSKDRNIPFYRRHGFEVTGEVKAKDGPTLWPMWRDPRPPDGTG